MSRFKEHEPLHVDLQPLSAVFTQNSRSCQWRQREMSTPSYRSTQKTPSTSLLSNTWSDSLHHRARRQSPRLRSLSAAICKWGKRHIVEYGGEKLTGNSEDAAIWRQLGPFCDVVSGKPDMNSYVWMAVCFVWSCAWKKYLLLCLLNILWLRDVCVWWLHTHLHKCCECFAWCSSQPDSATLHYSPVHAGVWCMPSCMQLII